MVISTNSIDLFIQFFDQYTQIQMKKIPNCSHNISQCQEEKKESMERTDHTQSAHSTTKVDYVIVINPKRLRFS